MKKMIAGILALIVLLSACTPPVQNEDSTESSKSYNLKAVGEHYKQERIFVGNYIIQMKAAYVNDGEGIVKFGLFNVSSDPAPYKENLKITASQDGKEIPVDLEYAIPIYSTDETEQPSTETHHLRVFETLEIHVHVDKVTEKELDFRIASEGEEIAFQLEPDGNRTEQMLQMLDSVHLEPKNVDNNIFILHYGMIHEEKAYITATRIGSMEGNLTDAFDIELVGSDKTVALESADIVPYPDTGYPTEAFILFYMQEKTKGFDTGSNPTSSEYVFRFPWKEEKSDTEWKLIIRSKKDPARQVEIPYRLVASPENPPSLFFPLDQEFLKVK